MIMMAVSSIHVVVRAVDDLCILVFKNTFALQVLPLNHFGLVVSCPEHDACAGVEAFYEIDEGLQVWPKYPNAPDSPPCPPQPRATNPPSLYPTMHSITDHYNPIWSLT